MKSPTRNVNLPNFLLFYNYYFLGQKFRRLAHTNVLVGGGGGSVGANLPTLSPNFKEEFDVFVFGGGEVGGLVAYPLPWR